MSLLLKNQPFFCFFILGNYFYNFVQINYLFDEYLLFVESDEPKIESILSGGPLG